MRGYEAAQILKAKGVTVEDVAEEIIYRKETNAFSNNTKNEAFMNMTLNELVRIKEMWNIQQTSVQEEGAVLKGMAFFCQVYNIDTAGVRDQIEGDRHETGFRNI